MQYLYFVFFAVGLILSLFTLFVLSKNDFVLLRRGVLQKNIFDTAFVSFVIGFVVARVFYIFDTFQFSYFYPIQFFHLILYPGLSIYGFVIGMISVVVYTYLRKKAFMRAFDLYAVAVYWLFLAYVLYGIVGNLGDFLRVFHVIVSVILFFVYVRFFRFFTLKDGGAGMLVVSYISLSYFLLSFEVTREVLLLGLSFGQIVSVLTAVLTLFAFVINQFFKK